MVLFFASWLSETSALRAELTALNGYAAQRSLPALTAVDETVTEPSPTAVRPYLAGLHYPVALDETGRVADGYQVQDQPWFALVNAKGAITWSHDGWLPLPALESAARHASRGLWFRNRYVTRGVDHRGMSSQTRQYAAFKLEQRGIDYIPHAERKMKPSGLFWLWAGGVFNVEFLYYGTLIMAFGLSITQAVIAVLVANVFYVFLGLASLQGPKTGTTALMVSRAPFGQNGNRLVALFNWVTQVGFEIEGVYFAVATVILLFSLHGVGHLNTAAKIAIIIVMALLQMIVPLLGHATISKVLRYLAYAFIVFFAVMAGFTFNRLHLSQFHHQSASWATWTTALVLLISVGGLGWTENGNDYSRYLPADAPARKTFWSATLGAAIPSIILELLGVFAFTIPTKSTAGITQLGIPQSFPSWFLTPFLIFAIFQLLSINTIDMYSSGVTLQALGVPLKRWGTVVLDTVVCAAITAYIVFHHTFYQDFSGFLLYIVVWLAPWFGILLTDYLLRSRRYNAEELQNNTGGVYWRSGGIHWPAIVAQAIGMVAALMWINAQYAFPSYVGPLSSHFPGLQSGDLSWLIGIVMGGGIYWALAGRSVRREAATAD
jgi:NCS1 family nucleobase:cation symporter-1